MASVGPNSPSAAATDSGTGTIDPFGSITNVFASDDSRSNTTAASFIAGNTTYWLKATGFGFAIPAGATITGVSVSIELLCNLSNKTRIDQVKLVKGGTVQGNDLADEQVVPTSETTYTYGADGQMWGLALSESDVEASNFGWAVFWMGCFLRSPRRAGFTQCSNRSHVYDSLLHSSSGWG
jgi:hypothetical protein